MDENTATEQSSSLSNDQVQHIADGILERAEYQKYWLDLRQPEDNMFTQWLKDLQKWLNDLFEFEGLNPKDGSDELIGVIVSWGLKGLILVILLFMVALTIWWGINLIRNWNRQRQAIKLPQVTHAQRLEAQDSLNEKALASLASHDYRQAIHYLFLAAVKRVIDDNYFEASDWMTNRELVYYSRFEEHRDHQSLLQLFSDMMQVDEPRWFGQELSSRDDYQRVRKAYLQFNELLSSQEVAARA